MSKEEISARQAGDRLVAQVRERSFQTMRQTANRDFSLVVLGNLGFMALLVRLMFL